MNFVETAYTKGLRARPSPSDGLLLRDGTRHRVLVDSSGTLTKFGREYEALAGEPLPAGGYDATQNPSRTGNVETVRLRGGKEAIVRRWDPSTGAFRYTRLGRAFYGQRRTQWVVKVPARFEGARPNGAAYARDGYWPVATPIPLSPTLTTAQRDTRIRAHVTALFADGVLAEYSAENVTLREGAWQIAELTTTPSADGPQAVVTERRLGVAPVSHAACFSHSTLRSVPSRMRMTVCAARARSRR